MASAGAVQDQGAVSPLDPWPDAAVAAVFEGLRRYACCGDRSPRAAVRLAVALEGAANRLLDLSDALNAEHLAAYNATLPTDLPDDTDLDAVD